MFNNIKISTLLFLLSSSVLAVLLAKQVRADCTRWHPHHCGIRDVEREFNNCFSGGCSIPADEAWGEAGRTVYTAGLATIAANNSTLPAKSLTTWQKDRLRPYFGNLVDRVRIKYGATTLDNWRIGGTRISVPSDGQTFCNNIYLTKRHRGEDKELLALIAHEMVHSQQCERLGGASNFGYNYFKYYKRANQNYRNNKLEVEAYDIEAKFVNELESIEREIATSKRHVDWSNNLGDRIQSHKEMPEGSFLQSGDGRFKMVVQGDGNLVIYQSNQPIWASNTSGIGTPGFKLAIQSDGNVVMYGKNASIWASNTAGVGTGSYTLVMQNDGNLVLYDRNSPIWASGTCCR